ncbi:MAG: GDSL-type esterase/lipase family protein [Phycisphaeraceae bacterium]
MVSIVSLLALTLGHCPRVDAADAVEVSGLIESQTKVAGKMPNYRLIGDTTFDWRVGLVTGDIDLNGHTLTMETGGGNLTTFKGVISGKGSLIWNGGGQDAWQTRPSFLAGDKPNTFTGTLTILRGTLALAKPKGTAALAGKLITLGGGTNQAILQLNASDQVPDDCLVRITGDHDGRIWMQGQGETLGPLDLQSHGSIDLGDGESKLTFADSSGMKWNTDKTLTIDRWTEGKDELAFRGANTLTPAQVARIGFADPSDRPAGLYAAKLLKDGQLVPDMRVKAIDPPFDVSDDARKARQAMYDIPGRDELTGEKSPLRDGMSISFFGDSITWQNGYISLLEKAIANGAGTRGKTIHLHNRGINGGGVLSVRDGVDKAAYVDEKNQNGPQDAFAKVIAADKAAVAVIFIGINDLWWRNTSPEDFDKALRDIVATARQNKTIPVLATLSVFQEMPDNSNPKDVQCEQFAELTRKVARETHTTLVDLRETFMAYLRNHNARLRVDGSLVMQKSGVLTYDGVHPSARGNELLSDQIASGIDRSLKRER